MVVALILAATLFVAWFAVGVKYGGVLELVSGRQSEHAKCLRSIGQLERGMFPRIPVEDRWCPWFAANSKVPVGEPLHPRTLLSYWLSDEEDKPELLGYVGDGPSRGKSIGNVQFTSSGPPMQIMPGDVINVRDINQAQWQSHEALTTAMEMKKQILAQQNAMRRQQEQYEYILRTYGDRHARSFMDHQSDIAKRKGGYR